MNYILIHTDSTKYIINDHKIELAKWGKKRKSEPTLIATTKDKFGSECEIAIPCLFIHSLIKQK